MSIIPSFPGGKKHNAALPKWIQHVRGFAKARDILGLTYTNEEWTTLEESDGQHYEIPKKPKTPASNASDNVLNKYKVLYDAYKQHLKSSNELRDAIIQSLANDPRSLALLVDIETISIAEIITQMNEEFGRWSAADLVELNQDLQKPWNPTESIFEFINKHQDIHKIFQKQNQPLNDFDKIRYLMQALRESRMYDAWYSNWLLSHSKISAQQYSIFVKDLNDYHPTTNILVSQLGYSTNMAATAVNTITGSTSPTGKVNSKKRKERLQYCWCSTHYLNHTDWSDGCKFPGANHKVAELKPPKGWTCN
jgi:hypothetical protein